MPQDQPDITPDITAVHSNSEAASGRLDPYPDPDRPGVMRVPIVSNKHKGMEAIIDAADLPLVRGRRWNWSGGDVVMPKFGSLTRVILGLADPALLVQHRNGDRLDCRRQNLLVRTRSQVAKARKPSPETLARLAPYPDPDRPGVWRVPLKSHIAQREALIDEVDLPIVRGKNWNWGPSSEGRTEGTVILATVGRQTQLHRMILNVTDPKTRVSFVNGDALDCRRANLSVLTLADSVRGNAKMGSVSGRKYTSDFKGVSWDFERDRWLVQIRKGRVYLQVGRFEGEVDAATAYDAAARVLFGEHAHLNIPDQPSSDSAMADARRAMHEHDARKRAQRMRQRQIERELRRACAESMEVNPANADSGAMISTETARQLFDCIPTVWERWERFGWVRAGAAAGGEETLISLHEVRRLLLRCGIVALPYPDPQRPEVYRVPLSGETAQGREALIDADAVPLVQTRRWRFAPFDGGRGGEVQTMNPAENIRLHYVVMGMSGEGRELHIGLRNDDPLDCRRENLVVRTQTDTAAHRRKQATICGRPCTSRFKGVYREKRSGRWVATIKKNRVQYRLGSFRDEIAAAQKYDEAARELFGEHARLNFPEGIDAWLEQEAARQQGEDATKQTREAA